MKHLFQRVVTLDHTQYTRWQFKKRWRIPSLSPSQNGHKFSPLWTTLNRWNLSLNEILSHNNNQMQHLTLSGTGILQSNFQRSQLKPILATDLLNDPHLNWPVCDGVQMTWPPITTSRKTFSRTLVNFCQIVNSQWKTRCRNLTSHFHILES